MFLYVDGNGRLQVANWSQTNVMKSSTILFTQFGSVVAFTHNNDSWDVTDIKFNPTSTTFTASNWAGMPCWNGDTTTDGHISSSSYHTITNVQAGRGDICQLVGYTVAEIKALKGVLAQPAYKMQTFAQMQTFVGTSTDISGNWTGFTSGSPGYGTFPGGVLPAVGYRFRSDGTPTNWGTYGAFWTSRPINTTHGYSLDFNINSLFPAFGSEVHSGCAIRCVRSG